MISYNAFNGTCFLGKSMKNMIDKIWGMNQISDFSDVEQLRKICSLHHEAASDKPTTRQKTIAKICSLAWNWKSPRDVLNNLLLDNMMYRTLLYCRLDIFPIGPPVLKGWSVVTTSLWSQIQLLSPINLLLCNYLN